MNNKALNIANSALVLLSAFFFANSRCKAAEEQFVYQPLTVSKILGEVQILPKGAENWQKAEPPAKLGEGDRIRTLKDAKAELLLKDGSFVRMKENTTLGVKIARQEVSSGASEYNLDFRIGEIMIELKKLKKGSDFRVETPTAVAAARGTTYYMRTGTKIVDGVEKRFVEIYVDSDDIIQFSSTVSGETCTVCYGQGAVVYEDGTVEEPYTVPAADRQEWKSGFDIVYDDSDEKGSKKGMRDVDEETDTEEDDTDDVSDEVDDMADSQDDKQQEANQDKDDEQDITGLAKVDIITDSDGDGYIDSEDAFPFDSSEWLDTDNDGVGNKADTDDDGDDITDSWEEACQINETNYNTNPLLADTDSDGIDDFEDAFPNDRTVNSDTSTGYGSWDELCEAAAEKLAELQGLKNDIATMVNDIHARGYEAAKENIFDHQAGKVMTDRWGNRVRVEEYVSKPTSNQVQILALNLRTDGPNSGVSSMDYRITFEGNITNTNLKHLPWDDYMDNPQVEDFIWDSDKPGNDEDQLILYQKDNSGYYNPKGEEYNYPIPLEFSLEVKNPYGDSVKAIESYCSEDSEEYLYEGRIKEKGEEGSFKDCWYQIEEDSNTYINNERKTVRYEYSHWGDSWNSENSYTFLERYSWGYSPSWLMGLFYLVDNDGKLVDVKPGEDGISEINGIRDLINPDHNLEMVFFSPDFSGNAPDWPDYNGTKKIKKGYGGYSSYEAYLKDNYRRLRTIDVITIPEITEPYRGEDWNK